MQGRIFVVEDDKHINEVVAEYLKEAGFDVHTYIDGKEAMEKLNEEKHVDLFIFDIMLPNVSGLELLKETRTREIYKDKPVIMLTALSDEYTQLLSFEGFADDYVTKPFSPKVLVKRVAALLRRTRVEGKIVGMGDIEIDVDSYEAFEGGEKIQLTLREFELLKVLMNNNRKVLSRQQLLNLVWGYDYFGDERIVDVHIKNLRKKFKSNIIATVKGVGYKIEIQKGGEQY